MNRHAQRDISGSLFALGCVALGAVALYYTKDMTRLGSIFPRAIGSALILLSIASLITGLVRKRAQSGAPDRGSWTRRVLLVVVVSAWALLLNKIGFLTTSTGAFAALLAIANYDPWTPRRLLLLSAIMLLTLGGLYTVFRFGLQVPLPTGVFL